MEKMRNILIKYFYDKTAIYNENNEFMLEIW